MSAALRWASSMMVANSEMADSESAMSHAPYSNVTLQLPSPPNSQVSVCGVLTHTIVDNEPVRITSPALHVMPSAPSVLASQINEFTGEPFTAAPAPVATNSPSTSMVMPVSAKSTSSGSL